MTTAHLTLEYVESKLLQWLHMAYSRKTSNEVAQKKYYKTDKSTIYGTMFRYNQY